MKPGNLCLLLEKISSLIPFIFFAPPIFFLLASFYCVHDTIDSTNASLAIVCTVVPSVKSNYSEGQHPPYPHIPGAPRGSSPGTPYIFLRCQGCPPLQLVTSSTT